MINRESIKKLLEDEFPGKTITMLPSEIVCEIEPAKEHPSWSEAIAYIKKSEPHYHNKIVEKYTVEQGELTLVVDGIKDVLRKGEKLTINPPAVHFAYGDWVRVRVYTKPGWTPEDHILKK